MHVAYFFKDENGERHGVRGNTYEGIYLSSQDGYIYLLKRMAGKPLKMCKPEQLVELYITDEKLK